MPIPRRYYEELQVKREEEHRAAERDRSRALLVSGLLCVLCCVLGLVAFGFALHTTNPTAAEIFRWTAYLVTYGGISVTLAHAYTRGEQRGDW